MDLNFEIYIQHIPHVVQIIVGTFDHIFLHAYLQAICSNFLNSEKDLTRSPAKCTENFSNKNTGKIV